MSAIEPIPNTDLTEYVVELLRNKNIKTPIEVLKADITRLSQICNLHPNAIIEIRKLIRSTYGPSLRKLTKEFEKYKDNQIKFNGTGIKSLDDILKDDNLAIGHCWEVCGPAGIGKSQLCLSIIINFLCQHDGDVLYVETKGDFIGTRIREMLKARNIKKQKCGEIMQRVKIERTFTAMGLLEILQKFQKSDAAEVHNIRLLIIDALPTVWLRYQCDDNRLKGKALLVSLANLLAKINDRRLLAIILVNLLVPIDDRFKENDINIQDDLCTPHTSESKQLRMRPTLGRYWSSVPRIRLSIETPIDCDDNAEDVRVIKILKSCYSSTGLICKVRLKNAGIVSD